MSSGAASGSATPSRLEEFLSAVPIITRVLLIANCLVHILIFVFSWSLNTFAISADLVIGSGEYYRVVSAAFVHAGVMHIFMNMSSLLQLGLSIEAQFGSLQFLFLSVWSVFTVGIVYVLLAVLFSYVDAGQYYASGVGYSGVLFTYALIEAYHTTETSRSIFGIVNVPAKMYPFILLIILQVVIPNISFLGHLSGILVGLLVVYGALNIILPSPDFLLYLETTAVFSPLTKATGYVRASNRSLVHAQVGTSAPSVYGCCVSVSSLVCSGLSHVWNLIAALLYIVGCPVERMTRSASDACASVTAFLRSLNPFAEASTSSGVGGGGGVELGRYARLDTTSSHGHGHDIESAAAISPGKGKGKADVSSTLI